MLNLGDVNVEKLQSSVQPVRPVEKPSVSLPTGLISTVASAYNEYEKEEAKAKGKEAGRAALSAYNTEVQKLTDQYDQGSMTPQQYKLAMAKLKGNFTASHPDLMKYAAGIESSFSEYGNLGEVKHERTRKDVEEAEVRKEDLAELRNLGFATIGMTPEQEETAIKLLYEYRRSKQNSEDQARDLELYMKELSAEGMRIDVEEKLKKEAVGKSIGETSGIYAKGVQNLIDSVSQDLKSQDPSVRAGALQQVGEVVDKAIANLATMNNGVLNEGELKAYTTQLGYLRDLANRMANGDENASKQFDNATKLMKGSSMHKLLSGDNQLLALHTFGELNPNVVNAIVLQPQVLRVFSEVFKKTLTGDKTPIDFSQLNTKELGVVFDTLDNMIEDKVGDESLRKGLVSEILNDIDHNGKYLTTAQYMTLVDRLSDDKYINLIRDGEKVLSSSDKDDIRNALVRYYERRIIPDFKSLLRKDFTYLPYGATENISIEYGNLISPNKSSINDGQLSFEFNEEGSKIITNNSDKITELNYKIDSIKAVGGPLSPESKQKKEDLIKQRRSLEAQNNQLEEVLKSLNKGLGVPTNKYIKLKSALEGSDSKQDVNKFLQQILRITGAKVASNGNL